MLVCCNSPPTHPPPLHPLLPPTPPRYEVPDIQFEKLAVRFMDIRKRVYDVRRAAIALWPGLGQLVHRIVGAAASWGRTWHHWWHDC